MSLGTHPCLSCGGRGETFYICEYKLVPCTACKGTGKVERDPEWVEKGQRLRELRLAQGRSLREFSTACDIRPVDLSSAERGRIDPAPMLAKVSS